MTRSSLYNFKPVSVNFSETSANKRTSFFKKNDCDNHP